MGGPWFSGLGAKPTLSGTDHSEQAVGEPTGGLSAKSSTYPKALPLEGSGWFCPWNWRLERNLKSKYCVKNDS